MKNNIISFVTTVFNEENTIEKLLLSLISQTKLPHEIVIVDGGSTDNTVVKIKNQISNIKNKEKFRKIKFKLIERKGNRAVGRNLAIKNAKGNIILISDAGCILDKNWVENIVKPFEKNNTEVVAGYYKGIVNTVFQKCLIPYVLVMPDKVNSNNFLPASRSMAIKKSLWKRLGGFPEKYSHNEDYVFANKLKINGVKIIFKKNAVVSWLPRKNLKEAFIMFYRFAFGDAESGMFRPKVILIFLRYILFSALIILTIFSKSLGFTLMLFAIFFIYLTWSIMKNYRYVNDIHSMVIFSSIQIASDFAVMSGTLAGLIRKYSIKEIFRVYLIFFILMLIFNIISNNKFSKFVNYLFLSVSFLPVLLITLDHKYRTLFIKVIGIYSIYGLFMLILFRFIRSLFPIPQINNDKIIGYAQYFGYPLYFDTLIFFSFIVIPAGVFYLFHKRVYKSG